MFLIHRISRARRIAKIGEGLPDALDMIGSALKAGLSFPAAVEVASMEMRGPIGEEFSGVSARLKLGQTVEESLGELARRVPTEDVALFVQSVEILRKTGGNLIETFSLLVEAISARQKVESRIKVLTSQGVYQGIVLISMPWLLGVTMHVMAPDYLEPLFKEPLGWLFIMLGVLLEIVGAVWLKKIVTVVV